MGTWNKKEAPKEKKVKDADREAELARRAQFGSHEDAIPLPKVAKGSTTPANFTLKSNG